MTNPILAALDVPTIDEAVTLRTLLDGTVGGIKLGLEFFLANGPAGVEKVVADRTGEFFLDLKLHDIPNTVAAAVASVASLSPDYLTVHATGGRSMLEAANQRKGTIKTLGVTILTSLDDDQLSEVGLPNASSAVPALAVLARESGCDGVICAPTDIAAVRAVCPVPFLIVTPGVRPEGVDTDDQARTMTPVEAMAAGADRLVIGRPITSVADPRGAAEAIARDLEAR
ncbi:MAG: orotidine-5'-phosphate decarboxylase [Actinomycetota bacterium]